MKKKQKQILIYFALAVAVLATLIFLNSKPSQVCFEKNCFNVEIAKTHEEKTKGLMFRENLEENAGMLFVYDEELIYRFWMMNASIPLDMVWIDANNEVVYIKYDAQPCSRVETCEIIDPETKAQYILEINAGKSEEVGLHIGSVAEFKNLKM